MQHIIKDKGDYTLLAHRGSYKSSCLSVCIALMMVLYPQSNIIFLRKADNDVAEMIRMVKKALESNEKYGLPPRTEFFRNPAPLEYLKLTERIISQRIMK